MSTSRAIDIRPAASVTVTGEDFDPSTTARFYDDFFHASISTQPVSNEDTFINPPFIAFDAGAFGGLTSIDGAPGVLFLQVASSSGSNLRRAIFMGGKFISLGFGEIELEWRARMPLLSTATDSFLVIIGAHTKYGGTVNDSIDLRYSHSDNAGQWRVMTREGGVITMTNTTVAPVANTWFNVKLVVSADGTTLTAYIDGVQVAQTTANIPNGIALAPVAFLNKLAGSATRYLEFDYFQFKQTFSTPRGGTTGGGGDITDHTVSASSIVVSDGANGTLQESSTATVNDGVGPFTYAWTWEGTHTGLTFVGSTTGSSVLVESTGTNQENVGTPRCTVTDTGNGSHVAFDDAVVSFVHGIPP